MKTARRGVLLGAGGMSLAIWASFFSPDWDLGDSFRWLVSFVIGAAAGLYMGLNVINKHMHRFLTIFLNKSITQNLP